MKEGERCKQCGDILTKVKDADGEEILNCRCLHPGDLAGKRSIF